MQRNRSLTGRLRTVNFYDSAARESPHAECEIQSQRAGGNHVHIHPHVIAELHDRSLSKLLVYIRYRIFKRFLLLRYFLLIELFRHMKPP